LLLYASHSTDVKIDEIQAGFQGQAARDGAASSEGRRPERSPRPQLPRLRHPPAEAQRRCRRGPPFGGDVPPGKHRHAVEPLPQSGMPQMYDVLNAAWYASLAAESILLWRLFYLRLPFPWFKVYLSFNLQWFALGHEGATRFRISVVA